MKYPDKNAKNELFFIVIWWLCCHAAVYLPVHVLVWYRSTAHFKHGMHEKGLLWWMWLVSHATIGLENISFEIEIFYLRWCRIPCTWYVQCRYIFSVRMRYHTVYTVQVLVWKLLYLWARLDCLTKPCDIIHMIVFSPNYQSDGFISCLHCLSDVFIIMGN